MQHSESWRVQHSESWRPSTGGACAPYLSYAWEVRPLVQFPGRHRQIKGVDCSLFVQASRRDGAEGGAEEEGSRQGLQWGHVSGGKEGARQGPERGERRAHEQPGALQAQWFDLRTS